jgi:hypothetical protein
MTTEVEQEKQAIETRLAELDAAKAASDIALDEAIATAKEKREVQSKYLRIFQVAMVRMRQLTEDFAAAELSVCARILESDQLSMKLFGEIDAQHIEFERLRIFSDKLASTFLKRAEADLNRAEANILIAESEQVDRLCDARGYRAQLLLLPLIEAEGQVIVDAESTATGLLRKKAANLRVQANSLLKKLETN